MRACPAGPPVKAYAPASANRFHLTRGEAADCKDCDDLIALAEQAPDAPLADNGYDADVIH